MFNWRIYAFAAIWRMVWYGLLAAPDTGDLIGQSLYIATDGSDDRGRCWW